MKFILFANEGTSLSVTARGVFFVIAFLFLVFSFLGWILEVLFRRFFSAKRWINPGFLKGPCLPIYGFGVVSMYILVSLLKKIPTGAMPSWAIDILIIVGIGILMTLIELIAGIIFIEGMHIRLWDYSSRPGNYKGIICPLFSLIWTGVGAGFYYLLYNPINNMIFNFLTLDWFDLAIFIMGLFYGIFIIDFCISMEVNSKIKKFASEHQIIIHFEDLKENISKRLSKEKLKGKFLSPFRSPHGLEEHMEEYYEDNKKKESFHLFKRKNKGEEK